MLKPVEILLVEDNPGDVQLVHEALSESKLKVNISVAIDGMDAWDFLNRNGKYANAPFPDIILLDLNLPKKDGRELLSDIKSNKNLKIIPVVILTTSEAESDILKSYELHANCYVTKPVDFNSFIEVVRSIENFWFTIVKLPLTD